MTILVPILIVLASATAMEVIAWAAHKYLMHGWGWGWHRTHHEPHEGWFEINDLYAIIFAIFAIGLFLAASATYPPLRWVATGMTLYGVLYAVVHDGLVHQRWPFRHVPKNGYLKRLVQAHRLHHAVHGRDHCVSFGFLYAAPVRSLKQELRDRNPAGLDAGAAE